MEILLFITTFITIGWFVATIGNFVFQIVKTLITE